MPGLKTTGLKRAANFAGFVLFGLANVNCGGPAAPSPAAAQASPTPVPNPNGFLYAQAADGYWGFKIGPTGQLTPVANGAISALQPSFSPDGSKAAFWDGQSLTVRTVNADGTFSASTTQLNLAGVLRNTPGNFGYWVVWNKAGSVVVIAGGSGNRGTTQSPNAYAGEIVAVAYADGKLGILPPGVLPMGVRCEAPLFTAADSLYVKHFGLYRGPGGDVRQYSVAGGSLTAGPVIPISIDTGENDYEAFLTSDEKFLVAGDISYGSTTTSFRPIDRMTLAPFLTHASLLGSLSVQGRFALLMAWRDSDQALMTYQVRDDGAFTAVSPPNSIDFEDFAYFAAQKGQVVVFLNPTRGQIKTVAVSVNGQLGAAKGSSWFLPRANYPSLSLSTNVTGAYMYAFSESAPAAARVDVNGDVATFDPFPDGTSFRRVTKTAVVYKP